VRHLSAGEEMLDWHGPAMRCWGRLFAHDFDLFCSGISHPRLARDFDREWETKDGGPDVHPD